MSTAPIRVMVVDDHVIVRKGTRAFLAEIDGIEVVGDTGSGHEAIRLVESLHPNVILVDLMMPEMDGVQTIQEIVSQYQDVRIVIMTSFIAEDKLFSALKAGAHNYLMKDSPPEDLVRKIYGTYRGESDLHHTIARKVYNFFLTVKDVQPLTSDESQVLQLLSQGLPAAEAAQKMGICETEVHGHIFQIIQKFHQRSQQ